MKVIHFLILFFTLFLFMAPFEIAEDSEAFQ
jgi:hypothetical protein